MNLKNKCCDALGCRSEIESRLNELESLIAFKEPDDITLLSGSYYYVKDSVNNVQMCRYNKYDDFIPDATNCWQTMDGTDITMEGTTCIDLGAILLHTVGK